jgi:predicted nuclease of predicted toxin-antitoxin system
VEQGKDAEELTAVARQEDGILFYMTGDVDIAKVFGLNTKPPALVLLKKQNGKLSTFGMINLLMVMTSITRAT